ncbi:hypothetical protein [Virgibacillus salexigens]|uniref:hypothetical protein n=1 Tax=Virgibacillus salexigens TaxID=61016 RepID=UPI001909E31D|nr:hypothetical protein [Virgibacillus salexigens]
MIQERSALKDNLGNFPGRWLGGLSLIISPILLVISSMLRIQFNFFFSDQLAAYDTNPNLMLTSFSFFLIGMILLFPAVLTLVQLISVEKPRLGLWGGLLVILGLFARAFHSGADHFAFQVVRSTNVEVATQLVGDFYGMFHIVNILNFSILFGWIVLAIGAYLSNVFGLFRSIALGMMFVLAIGILKGTNMTTIISLSGLCMAFLPLGIQVLKSGTMPKLKTVLLYLIIIVLVVSSWLLMSEMERPH